MAPPTAVPETTWQQVRALGSADILFGIPSFKNYDTIGHVASVAAAGLRRYFPELNPILINSDGKSPDRTPDAFTAALRQTTVPYLTFEYDGPPGKGSAFRAIFEIAEALGVRACVVVDSDLRSITEEWIERLAAPVVHQGYGFVTPFYVRHKYDGTITNNVTYPLIRTLYGQQVRQPIGGDFGFSGALAATYARAPVWDSEVARFGIDVFMTTTALAEGHRVCQANLGAKVHDPRDPAASLGPMFMQVVDTLFALMPRYEANWRPITGSQPVPRYGPEVQAEPEPVAVNLQALVSQFKAGAEQHEALWRTLLTPPTFANLSFIVGQSADGFSFPPELWARVLYDLAVAHASALAPPAMLIDSITPLYYGRTAGLVVDTAEMDGAAFEAYVSDQAATFERLKPYLLSRWDELPAAPVE